MERLSGLGRARAPLSSLGAFVAVAVPVQDSPFSLVAVGDNGRVGAVNSALSAVAPLGEFSLKPALATIDVERGLVGVSGAERVEVLDLASGLSYRLSSKLDTRITALRFQVGRDALLMGAADGRIYRWKYGEPDLKLALERYFGLSTVVSAVVGHTGGRVFFSGDWSGSLQAWLPYDEDAFRGKYDKNLFTGIFAESAVRQNAKRSDTISISDILVSPDGASVFVVLQDGRVEWWMVRGLKKLGEVQAHKGLIYGAALSRDGSRLATVGRDGKARVFTLTFTDGAPPTVSFTQTWQTPATNARLIEFLGANQIVVAGPFEQRLLSFKF